MPRVSRSSSPRTAELALLTCLALCSTGVAAQTPPSPADAAPAAIAASTVEGAAQEIPSGAVLEQQGARVGNILIDPENIFDTSDPREDYRLYRLANLLHIKTHPEVIRQQLLFKSGEPYSQRLVEESERILRGARYLYDARIKPVAYHDGVVDLMVTTRDVWTLNPGISFGRHGGKNTTGIELEELNILGTGTSLSLAQKSGLDRDTTAIEFKDPHVLGSWVTLAAMYSDNSDGRASALTLDRPFYALDTRWAAGVNLLDQEQVDSLYDLGHVVDQFREQRQFAEAYWGRSSGLRNGWTRRWLVGATYDEKDFSLAPDWRDALLPQDRKFVYPWIGFELIQDDYTKYRNHDQIGRTEDFHLGTRLSARLGWASSSFGSNRDALIFSATAGYGMGTSEKSTLLFKAGVDGRYQDGGLRDAVLKAAARYYNKQSEQMLFFADLSTTAGHRLDLDDQILLGGDNGLRGYPLRYQNGDASALLTLEQRYFTHWYPFRLFRVGAAAFFDIGRTWGNSDVSTPSPTPSQGWLKDIGLGLRLGNSRSGLGNVVHVDLAFPLDGDPSIKNVQLTVETKQKF